LRAVTDLFLSSCNEIKDEQIEVFDEVFESLVEGSDASALVETSRRLSHVQNSPPRMIRRLANDDAVEVASPVLQFSPRLTADDLRDIASTKGNGHLLAISKRKDLQETVTDVLISRGDVMVAATVAGNGTARLSGSGLQTLVQKATKNDEIAERLITRPELSPDALNQVVVARQKREAERETRVAAAQRSVVNLKHAGNLNDQSINEFASTAQIEHAIAGIALLSGLDFKTVEGLMRANPPSGFVLVCKAIALTWGTISRILSQGKNRTAHSETDMRAMYSDFMKLSKANAERILRFWNVRARVH
jgi:hypothetical protein